MSELVNARDSGMNFRWQLLSTVSALALLASVYVPGDTAKAADTDSDHPPVWIELGGQLSRLDDSQEAFSPPRMDGRPSTLSPSQPFERMPLYSIDESGKISFEPDGSDWVFSASVVYGHSGSDKHVRQQTNPKPFYFYSSGQKKSLSPGGANFADTLVQDSERHFIVDFQAGKDVGLGMFGGGGSSVFNLGVRFAQFSAKSNIILKSEPDWQFGYKYAFGLKFPITNGVFHSNAAQLTAARSFHGIGPSLSWNASAPVAGAPDHGEIALDWGLNAAILFGRQRTKLHHQTTGRYHGAEYLRGFRVTVYHPTPVDITRARTVTVPNVGGFAGVSFHYSNAKVSFGYRGDFFFGAMDGGIDMAKKENVGFYGPFASVSVGIGG